jgi:tetratricopeptide (TPR) repeat protein
VLATHGPLVVVFDGFDDSGPVLFDMLDYLDRTLEGDVRIVTEPGRGDHRPADDAAAAGRRALRRGDLPAAVYLLERAVTERDDPDLHALLAEALIEVGDLAGAGEHCRAAYGAGDPRALSLTLRAREGEVLDEETLRAALEGADESASARVLELIADVRWSRGEFTSAGDALTRSFEHAFRADARRDLARVGAWLLTWMYLGSMPVPDAIATCEGMVEATRVDPLLEARRLAVLGGLHGMRGDFDRGRALVNEARILQQEFGQPPVLGGIPQIAGEIELRAGDPEAAERAFKEAYERIEVVGDAAHRAATDASVARAMLAAGRIEEAERVIAHADERAAGSIRALIRASRGDCERAVADARAEAQRTDPGEEPVARANALVDLVHVLRSCGRPYEQETAKARELLSRKGILVSPL